MIIDFLLTIHAWFYGLNDKKHYKNHNTFLWVFTNVGARLLAWSLNNWIKCKGIFHIMPHRCPNVCDELVLSLTTFPPRINKLWMTIDSLMRQTVQPKAIELHLSLIDFPKGEEDLPSQLLRYKKDGLEIYWHKENLKPHKKYIYAFQKYPNKCVVTVDDDLYYRKDMIERLWQLHSRFPNCVCANTVRTIPNLITTEYIKWDSVHDDGNNPSHHLIAIGCGGVLYPVNLFNQSCYNDYASIEELALSTDDLWLKAQELLADIKVVSGNYYCKPPSVSGSQDNALSKTNWKEESRNDINWRKLRNRFGEIDKILS